MENDVELCVLLVDFTLPSSSDHDNTTRNSLSEMMRNKFTRQQAGKKKFLENRNHSRSLDFLPIEFMKDKSFVLNYIQHCNHDKSYEFLKSAAIEFRHDPQVMIEIVKHAGYMLEYACADLRNDKDLVMEAVKQHGNAYSYASETLKNDKDIILAAVKQWNQIRFTLANEWKNDNDIFLCSICPNVAHKYSHTHWNNDMISLFSTLKDDKEFLLDAVERYPTALQFISDELRNDKQFILSCVKQNGDSLRYASDDLINDKELVLKALKQDVYLLENVSDEIKSDNEFIMRAVQENGFALVFAPQSFMNLLQHDRSILLQTVKLFGSALQYASYEMQNDKEIVLEAVQQNGHSLVFASDELKDDQEIVLAAVTNQRAAFQYASTRILNDKEFVLQLIRQNLTTVLAFASPELRQCKEIALEAARHVCFAWDCIISHDPDHPLFLYFSNEILFSDPDMMLECAKYTGYAHKYSDTLYKARMDHYYDGIYLGNHSNKVSSG
ncbi:hypothetical protein C9374_009485 [Naegleria lovaniensis]|uniref:DUF4116 domain-containing protein n=1 Tax=Naegleria lovaniensis TaxID=51637 RepID=A0AA88H1D4_NAELO|nr:uncharacterized protein C9374_009485 [Naegleria lovaniensis]KAG2392908.1 hypothetical protein C9374_009485 [Naegleria lovaniensis]